MTALICLTGLACLAWLALASVALRTALGVQSLVGQTGEPPPGGFPPLSVIVACRNEEAKVEGAVRSLLGQDYPHLEVVVVDDRSTDSTGRILEGLAQEDPRLRVLHVETLPEGFLGKTHACLRGAEAASGTFLLFTDADVYFSPDALRRAVGFAERHRLGHLVVLPRLIAPHFLERGLVAAFVIFASTKFRAWELSRPGTRGFIGIGAFNLVRATDYRAVGGHVRLAFEVVDDVKLGMLLRRSGVPQAALDSGGLVRVRWNAGFRGTIRGLLKNAFAGVEWRWSVALLGSVAMAGLIFVPFIGLAEGDPWARGLSLASIAIAVIVHGGGSRRMAQGTGLEGMTYPLSDLSLLVVLLWSAARATAQGGIIWRDTFYPLPALKTACLRERDFPRRKAVGWD